MSNYKKLRKAVKRKCEIKDFKEVNAKINDILSNEHEDNKIELIKSLICHFEAKLNKANYYALIAVCFALIIGSISLFDKDQNLIIFLVFFVIFIALLVIIYSAIIKNIEYKDTFVLKALTYKLDELTMRSTSSKETSTTNELDTSNGANTVNVPDETRGYKDYLVRVYDK